MLEKYKLQNKKSLISTLFSLGAFSLLTLNLAPTLSHADTLQMPSATTVPKSFSVTLPGRGMSMTEVLDNFGDPEERQAEVGEPPITRWIYSNYVVIFEYQYVIHALASRKPMGFMPPETPPQSDSNMPVKSMSAAEPTSEQEMPVKKEAMGEGEEPMPSAPTMSH